MKDHPLELLHQIEDQWGLDMPETSEDRIKFLKREFKFLNTFLTLQSFTDESNMLGVTNKVPALLRGAAIDLRTVSMIDKVDGVTSQLQEKVWTTKLEIKAEYSFLKVSPDKDCIAASKFVTEFIDAVIGNLGDLVKNNRSSSLLFVPGSKKELGHVFKELKFLRNFVCFVSDRSIDHSSLDNFFIHVLAVAGHAAMIAWLYLPSNDNEHQDLAPTEMNVLLSDFLRTKIKPIQPEVCKIYIDVLQALRLTIQSPWHIADYGVRFVQTLQHNLKELATLSNPGWIVASMDQIEALHEMLEFLISNLINFLIPDLEFHLQYIEIVMVDSGLLVYSLYEDVALGKVTPDLPGTIQRIKTVIYHIIRKKFQNYLPRIHGLGYFDFLLNNLKEFQVRYSDSLDFFKTELQIIQNELDSLQPFIKSVAEEGRMNHKTLQHSVALVIGKAYEVEYIVDACVSNKYPDWCLMLWLLDLIKEIKAEVADIKILEVDLVSHDTVDTEDLGTYIASDPKAINIEQIYQHLPHHLKPCFLYFATFLEDREINASNLTWLWIGEGFVQEREDKSLQDIAGGYLEDLIRRNLVMDSKRSSDGKVKACHIHDSSLYYFCRKKAEEELFLLWIKRDQNANPSSSIFSHKQLGQHRLAFLEDVDLVEYRLSSAPVGSIIYREDKRAYVYSRQLSQILNNFKFLKVLDLLWVVTYSFPTNLVYLRYFAAWTKQKSITSSIANLWNLETLIVIPEEGKLGLPNAVWKMVKLRNLRIYNAYFNLSGGNELLDKLEILSSPSFSCAKDVELLSTKTPNLRELKCSFVDFEDEVFPRLEVFLTRLERLEIHLAADSMVVAPYNFPSSLRKLTLSNFFLGSCHESNISKLSNLQVLKLVSIFFDEDEWKVNDGEFRNLKVLKLVNCEFFEEWQISDHAFLSLEHLVLRECRHLKQIPVDFGYLSSLKTIKVKSCSESLARSAMAIREDQESLGNGGLEVFIQEKKDRLSGFDHHKKKYYSQLVADPEISSSRGFDHHEKNYYSQLVADPEISSSRGFDHHEKTYYSQLVADLEISSNGGFDHHKKKYYSQLVADPEISSSGGFDHPEKKYYSQSAADFTKWIQKNEK